MQLHEKESSAHKIGVIILWSIPLIFFFLVCFKLMPPIEQDKTIVEMAVSFLYIGGTTVIAYLIYKKHYPRIKDKISKPITIIFVPLTYIYAILFETAFNYGRFIREGFKDTFLDHMQYHLFNDTLVFIVSIFAMWLVFRKVPAGKWTSLAALIIAIIFQFFLTTTLPNQSLGERTAFGLFWIWLFHVTWFLTCLLLHPRKKLIN